MPTIPLTDRKIASLKPSGEQRDYFDRSFPGFGLRLNQGGRKSFILMYRTTEKKLRRMVLGVYGPEAPGITLAKARELARKELDKATIGRDPAAERKRAKPQTFSALMDLYLERHAKREKRSWRDDARRLRRLAPIGAGCRSRRFAGRTYASCSKVSWTAARRWKPTGCWRWCGRC